MWLSNAKEKDLVTIESECQKGKLVEIRGRQGVLIAVANSLTCFQKMKDKRNKFIWDVVKKNIPSDEHFTRNNQWMKSITLHDLEINYYDPDRKKFSSDQRIQDVIDKTEKYWKEQYARYNTSTSLRKEINTLINKI